MKRTLKLDRETLADLSPDELSDVLGGQVATVITCADMNRCISKLVSCFYC